MVCLLFFDNHLAAHKQADQVANTLFLQLISYKKFYNQS